MHENGIKTFASFEPTIEPEESLALIRKTLEDNSVDHYKIGKTNNYRSANKWQDWAKYLEDCVKLLRPTGKQVYYKFCLRNSHQMWNFFHKRKIRMNISSGTLYQNRQVCSSEILRSLLELNQKIEEI